MRLLPLFLLAAIAVTSGSAAFAQDSAETSTKISGIDQSLFSESVDPGDNFYTYANQKWLDATEIPSDKSNYGVFNMLADSARESVRELIEAAANQESEPDSAAQKVGDLYESVLNVDGRNEAGISPIRSLLIVINNVTSRRTAAAAMGTLQRSGVYGPLDGSVGIDTKKSDQYAIYLTQGGLTLPDRDYYLEDDERYVKLRGELKAYIGDMLGELGVEDPAGAAEAIFNIESQLAESQWTKTKNRDPNATYNLHTVDEITERLDGFDWAAFSDTTGYSGNEAFIVKQPSFAADFAKLFASVDVETWKNYMRFRVIDAYASSLSESLEQKHFAFHSTAISGISEQKELWKRGVDVTGSVLGELVGQLYVEKNFKPAAKARMLELVENLKKAFAARIKTREWMGEGTKKEALKKLELFTAKIAYPDKWKDYSKLRIESDLPSVNLIAAAEFEYSRDLAKLGGPIDRTEWLMTPQTVNAYYYPPMNEIVFPAAILQPPFFNIAADDAVNYGGIGAVIGHELSHGFDDKGSQYDGKGNLRKWWTEEDRAEFESRSKALVEQYNQFEPLEGSFVNGEFTLGENIGDLGGLNVAYEAYKISLGGEPAPVIDGLTGDQRFFLNWSQIWRRLYRKSEMLKRLVDDPHSPSEFRVNGIVRNMDAWYEAFGIKPSSKLFLPPDQRVRIW